MNNRERDIKEILKDLEELLSRINNGSDYKDILKKYKYKNIKQIFDLVYVCLIRDYYDKEKIVCLPMEENI